MHEYQANFVHFVIINDCVFKVKNECNTFWNKAVTGPNVELVKQCEYFQNVLHVSCLSFSDIIY